MQCDGLFISDLQPRDCVSVKKMELFLAAKWIPGREPLAEEGGLLENRTLGIRQGLVPNVPIDLPEGYIEVGHFYEPYRWIHHRSVMADFVSYMLSRPKEAIPKVVRSHFPQYARLQEISPSSLCVCDAHALSLQLCLRCQHSMRFQFPFIH